MSTPLTSERKTAFHLGQVFTKALRELYKAFDGDLTMALVLGELGQYATGSLYDSSQNRRSPKIRCSNAYSISVASGVPRETVRRKLDKLIARGWVIETPDGKLGLNLEHDPSLAILFSDYNRRMLQAMRESLERLDEIEKP